jgi:hypothetical protein
VKRTSRAIAGIAAAVTAAATAVLVTTAATTATAAPTPIRAAFDYNWYPQAEHWASHYTPTLGKYNSSDPAVLAAQVTAAKYAGLDAFITSWWGQGTSTDVRLPLALRAAADQGFHLTPYYEKEGNGVPSSNAQLAADFSHLYTETVSPGWLRIAGKPVLFIYNALASQSTCGTVDRIKTANAGRFYLNMKVFNGYRTCPSQPDSWHQYGPSSHYDRQGNYSVSVSPGFFKFNESQPRLARSLARFKTDLAAQAASNAQWQLVTTFNEWGEGTSVESATAWRSGSGQGAYLDAMRAAYRPPASQKVQLAAFAVDRPHRTKPHPTHPTTPTTTVIPPAGKVTKTLVIIEENHSLNEMLTRMPYLTSQATAYGRATNYTAIRHPSLPNYLAIAAGSTFGVTDDGSPAAHPIAGRSVFGAAAAAGKTAKSYQESMPGNCALRNSGGYAVKHNPWAYFTAERAQCALRDVPSGTYLAGALRNDVVAGTLPTVAEVTPNLLNDAHDGSLATADTWLKNWLTLIYAAPDWRAGRLAIIITADEDDSSQGNKVLTTVIHPSQHAHLVTAALNHYSLSAYLSGLSGTPCINAACSAPNFAAAFGL